MALEKPKPQATIETRNPVKESKPIVIQTIAIIGSNVNISSKSPSRAPNSMNTKAMMARSKNFLCSNFFTIPLTITLIPFTSFIAWNAPAITTRNNDNIMTVMPSLEPISKNGAKMPFKMLIPGSPSNSI